jgi:DNA-binding MarR family transcriptional regulator
MKRAGREDFLRMPGHLLRRCHQIGVAVFLDRCKALDLTPLQYSTLAALERFGAMDQASLGGAIALDRTTILVVLTRLEKRGLVKRRTSPKDRRSKLVEITAAGRRLVARALPSVVAVQDKLLAPLSARERAQLIAILSKVADDNNGLSRAPHRLP